MQIGTLDNPRWTLSVDLSDTPLEHKEFHSIKIERAKNDWVFCKIENSKFTGFGGPKNLSEIIQVFTTWAS